MSETLLREKEQAKEFLCPPRISDFGQETYVTSGMCALAGLPRVAMISLWRNDTEKFLDERIQHLLTKSYPNLHWIWLVGDCKDDTLAQLRGHAAVLMSKYRRCMSRSITIINSDTGIPDDRRLERLSVSASVALDFVRADDDYVVFHESDLVSPVDIVERLIASDKCPVGAWPVIQLNEKERVFYDIWAYRDLKGRLFSDKPPYCEDYTPDKPFEVSSVGSVWMFHAEDAVAGLRMYYRACLELCEQLRAKGRHIWVDPRIEVEQPTKLWTPYPVNP
jgi:hypothetical protein